MCGNNSKFQDSRVYVTGMDLNISLIFIQSLFCYKILYLFVQKNMSSLGGAVAEKCINFIFIIQFGLFRKYFNYLYVKFTLLKGI